MSGGCTIHLGGVDHVYAMGRKAQNTLFSNDSRCLGVGGARTVSKYFEVQTDVDTMHPSASRQATAGALGHGAEPVPVSLPLDGQQLFFEKLLALDEPLWVSFDYKGLR